MSALPRPLVRGVLFDLDDTLTDRRATVAVYAQRFVHTFRGRLRSDALNTLASELGAADQSGYNRNRAADIAASAIWSERPMASEIAAHWEAHYPLATVAREHCVDTLRQLRVAGIRLAVVTNGWTRSQHLKLRTLGIHDLFHAIVVSEEFGAKKPDPGIFRSALERLNLSAAACAFVGDNPINDVQGAAAVGLRAIWLCASLAWPVTLPPPQYRIERFPELLPLLGLPSHG